MLGTIDNLNGLLTFQTLTTFFMNVLGTIDNLNGLLTLINVVISVGRDYVNNNIQPKWFTHLTFNLLNLNGLLTLICSQPTT